MPAPGRDIALRIGAGVAACTLLPIALASSLVALAPVVYAARLPDRFAPQGDPCCPLPQSWGDVVRGALLALPLLAVAALLCTTVASLALTVVRERGLPRRMFLWVPLLTLTGLPVVLPLGWIVL